MIRVSASISVQYDNPFSPFPGSAWREGLAWVKRCGFDAVELIVSDPTLLDVGAIRDALDAQELPVSTISTGQAMGMEGIAMCAPSRTVREAARRRLFEDIDFSAALGGANVTVGLIRGRGGELAPALERELLRHELRIVAEYAAERGVRINLEPINRYECKLLNATADGCAVLQEIGNPKNVGILYDTFHSNIEDADMFSAIADGAAVISHVHLADSNRRLPGEGHIDFPRVIRTLDAKGYDGYVSLEVLNNPSAAHVQQNAAQAIRTIFAKG